MATQWTFRDRHVVGISFAGGNSRTIAWGLDPELEVVPWPAENFPALLLLGLGFTYDTSATVATRRPAILISQPGNAGSFRTQASVALVANQTRRYEFGPATHLNNPLAAPTVYREPWPRGIVLLGGPGVSASIQITLLNAQSEDALGDVTVTGVLLWGDGA